MKNTATTKTAATDGRCNSARRRRLWALVGSVLLASVVGQWSSPSAGLVKTPEGGGRMQVFMAGGDGWLYGLDAKTGKHIWKCDLNPKTSKWLLEGRGTRNSIIATPVFYENTILIGVGQDPDHLYGVGSILSTTPGPVTSVRS